MGDEKLVGPQPETDTIDLSKSGVMVCEKCENDTFIMQYVLRKVSALISQTGRPEVVSLPVFACAKCQHVNTDLGRELLNG